MITFDDSKQRENLRKHMIDLADLDRVVFLVWTLRGDNTAHLISCRHANRQETADYFSAF